VDVLRDYLQYQMNTAQYEKRELHIAISGGKRILDCMSSLENIKRPLIHFYASAAIGRGNMRKHSHITPEVNATIAWERSGMLQGHLHYVSVAAPVVPIDSTMTTAARHRVAVTSLQEHAATLERDHIVGKFLQDLSAADIVVSEITSIDGDRTPFADGLFETYGLNIELLKKSHVVGAVNYELIFNYPRKPSPDETEYQRLKSANLFLHAGHPAGIASLARQFHLDRDEQKMVIVIGEFEEWRTMGCAMDNGMINTIITDRDAAGCLAPQPIYTEGSDSDAQEEFVPSGYERSIPRLEAAIKFYRESVHRDVVALRKERDNLKYCQEQYDRIRHPKDPK